jgi:hypothetical protein
LAKALRETRDGGLTGVERETSQALSEIAANSGRVTRGVRIPYDAAHRAAASSAI